MNERPGPGHHPALRKFLVDVATSVTSTVLSAGILYLLGAAAGFYKANTFVVVGIFGGLAFGLLLVGVWVGAQLVLGRVISSRRMAIATMASGYALALVALLLSLRSQSLSNLWILFLFMMIIASGLVFGGMAWLTDSAKSKREAGAKKETRETPGEGGA
jgi:hypothetical protein